jgi:hypothetical protein
LTPNTVWPGEGASTGESSRYLYWSPTGTSARTYDEAVNVLPDAEACTTDFSTLTAFSMDSRRKCPD